MGTYHPNISDEDFLVAKEKVDAAEAERKKACTHEVYRFLKHGRCCPCGEILIDFGD